MPQYMRPQGVPVTVGWSGLAADVADASGVDDATYIASPTPPTSASYWDCALSAVTDPNTDEGLVLRFRTGMNATGGDSMQATVRIYRAVDNVTVLQQTRPVSYPMGEVAVELTPDEAAAIASYGEGALRVRVWAGPATSATIGTWTAEGAGWLTFGVAVPQGSAPSALRVGALPTQTDIKTRWPDGSVKYAVVTARPSAATTCAVTAGAVSGAALTPTWPTATVQYTLSDGTAWTATLPAYAAGDDWLAGPLVRETRVYTVPTRDGTGTAHGWLQVVWDVRVYDDGTYRVDVVGQNTKDIASANAVSIDDLRITINGAQVYRRQTTTPISGVVNQSGPTMNATAHGLYPGDVIEYTSGPNTGYQNTISTRYNSSTVYLLRTPPASETVNWKRIGLKHWARTRWRKTFTGGPTTLTTFVPDMTPFTTSKAIPKFLSTVTNPTYSLDTGFDIGQVGDFTLPMDSCGGRGELGAMVRWCANYVVHPTNATTRAYMLGHATTSASWGMHYNDPDGVTLPDIDRYPNYWLGSSGRPNGPASAAGAPIGWNVDRAHQPQMVLVPYLVTGDRFYLDELRYWMNFNLIGTMQDGSYPVRQGTLGILADDNQVRGTGWTLRNIAEYAAWAPDNDAYKSYAASKTTNNLVWCDNYAQGLIAGKPALHPLGFVWFEDAKRPETTNYPPRVWIATWEQAYVAYALWRCGQLGFTGGAVLRGKLGKMMLDMFTAPGFGRTYAGIYCVAVGTVSGGVYTYYTTMAQAYAGSVAVPNNVTSPEGYPSDYGPYYGPECRFLLYQAKLSGYAAADAEIAWLMAYVNTTPGQSGTTMAGKLNDRAEFAVDFS